MHNSNVSPLLSSFHKDQSIPLLNFFFNNNNNKFNPERIFCVNFIHCSEKMSEGKLLSCNVKSFHRSADLGKIS